MREVKPIIAKYPELVNFDYEGIYTHDISYSRLIILAAKKDCLPIVDYLVKKGADINAICKNVHGDMFRLYTPLRVAPFGGSVSKYLIENGADIGYSIICGNRMCNELSKLKFQKPLIVQAQYQETLLGRNFSDLPGDLEFLHLLIRGACARKPIVLSNTLVISPEKPEHIEKEKILSEYWDACQKEIDETKGEKISGTDISIYDILITPILD